MFDLKLNKYELFSLTWIVGRGSETQLEMGENLNYIATKLKISVSFKRPITI